MKSYLSLIPISARVHRRQNRMTLLCIIFAVFMVTAVFSMAEMGARMEQARLLEKHGTLSVSAFFDSAMGQSLLLIAGLLFLLILIAGVLMISGSINSSVAQRTKFFGMMRCIGMSREQILRFVRLEALNWCKTAVPIGLGLGVAASWGLCAALRFLVGEEFAEIPLFGVSFVGILSGVLVGVITVLLAARTPAKRAAAVPPIAAVSGNAEKAGRIKGFGSGTDSRIDTALGIHHAASSKKNLLRMTGSFALSILLFLSFSVLIELVDHVMPQSAAAADLELASLDGGNSLNAGLTDTLSRLEGVKRAYGRRSFLGMPVEAGTADLISFEDFDLECLKKDGVLKRGSDLDKIYGSSRYVLAAWDPYSSWEIGDRIRIGGEELEIAGLLNYDPFSADGLTNGQLTLIVSDETFIRLTGEAGYSLVMVQLENGASEKDVAAVQEMAGADAVFSDKRDQSTSGTYLAFVACVYGFLAIITLVTVLNIVNSISMSVSARIHQYGAMRAVGMDGRQMTMMIAAEAFTYAFWGCAAGCTVGLLLHRFLYESLITSHFAYAVWRLPVSSLAVILVCVVLAAAAAVYGPAKRIRKMAVTEVLGEL